MLSFTYNIQPSDGYLFQNMGPSPSGTLGHVVASDGTRVFVLGELSTVSERADETTPIHVVDTSTYFRFCHFIWTASKFQTGHIVYPKPDPTLSSNVGRPTNSCPSHPRVSWPRSNHNARHLFLPMRMQYSPFSKSYPHIIGPPHVPADHSRTKPQCHWFGIDAHRCMSRRKMM
jgi:hypothetical protein